MENKKFKAVGSLVWDMESPAANHGEAKAEAKTHLTDLLAKYIPEDVLARFTIKVNVQPVVEKQPKRIVYGELSPEEVFAKIQDGKDNAKQEFIVNGGIFEVKMDSLRYKVFERDACKCVCCGLVGTRMVLEKQRSSPRPHFNLYAMENGAEVLMTKDHILPVSHGGPEHMCNLQTMCMTCNILKGAAKGLTLEALLVMRKLYNEKIGQGRALTSVALKKLKLGLAEKEKFAERRAYELNSVIAKEKAGWFSLRFVDEVQVWKVPEGGYAGFPVTQKKGIPKKAVKVDGVIFLPDTVVKPIRARNDKIHVPFGEDGLYCRVAQILLEYHNEKEPDRLTEVDASAVSCVGDPPKEDTREQVPEESR